MASDYGGRTMRKLGAILILVTLCAVTVSVAEKQKGTTNLQDVQPVGITDKKNKNQQLDFSFEASGMHYTCRTSPKTSVKATDFVVGHVVDFEVNGDNGKLKNKNGKSVKCKVVRVENLSKPQK
jgi:hypothetical protein